MTSNNSRQKRRPKASKPSSKTKRSNNTPSSIKDNNASITSNNKSRLSKEEQRLKSRSQVFATILFAIAILLLFIIVVPGESAWRWMHSFTLGLFGTSAILWPLIMGYISIRTAFEKPINKISKRMWLCVTVVIIFCTNIYLFTAKSPQVEDSYWQQLLVLYDQGSNYVGGGFFSGVLGIPLAYALGIVGARILTCVLFIVSVMFLAEIGLVQLFKILLKPINMLLHKKHDAEKDNNGREEDSTNEKEKLPEHPVCAAPIAAPKSNDKLERLKKAYNIKDDLKTQFENTNEKDKAKIEEGNSAKLAALAFIEKQKKDNLALEKVEQRHLITNDDGDNEGYKFPSISLLEASTMLDETNITDELQHNGEMLVDTLKSFNVETKIINISRGPAVTRYELQPASGVKISKITNLADDIALNLAAYGVRIEAPIPGKAAVGIEVPNNLISIVKMRELVESKEFSSSKSKVSVILGKDISGNVKVADLSKMPHILIAGSTGSGKSVCINSFIISLLYKSTPDEVRLLMIDPKVVELGIYNGIPHLLVPVVTDPRKAAGALNWAVTEMLNRYKIFADCNVRDLHAYNQMVKNKVHDDQNLDENEEELKPMPQIVIIIDELADLMMAAPNEVEDAICRLAQMARAAGMHLVIATQRPSVDVITGIIKANIPSRIALAVSSQVDSRTILDMSGAEKLLGRGDMLFSPIGASKPMRVQGCYVTDKEIENIIDFIKKSQTSEYDEEVIEQIEKNAVVNNEKGRESNSTSTDPMMPEAIKCVVESGQASTSLLQRRLRLGYARAGRLIDEMEQMGIVGPHEGSKPRQVLISHNQLLEMNMRSADEQ